MRTTAVTLLAILISCDAHEPPDAELETIEYRATGAEWIHIWNDRPPGRNIVVADVDLCGPGLETRATGLGTGTQVVSSFAAATGALVAINGGHTWGGVPGPTAHAGQFFGLPDAGDLGQAVFGPGMAQLIDMSAPYIPAPSHREVVTGLLTLVQDGAMHPALPHTEYTCAVQHPRTLLGLTADRRRLLMVVVDGRAPGRTGMTCAESAAYMLSLGAHWALNLDGGGSSAMVAGGVVRNHPSDGSERPVGSHLGIVRTPGARGHCPDMPPPPPAPGSCGALVPGQALGPGQSISSCDGRVTLAHQGDGNAVLYGPDGEPLWHSATNGQATTSLIMQGDGNLVLYGPAGALWSSGTGGYGAGRAWLSIQNDGNAVVYAGGYALWATGTGLAPPQPTCGALAVGATLAPGAAVTSCDGRFAFVHQGDGNVVLYQGGTPLWDTGTAGQSTGTLAMQGDGNLVLYSASGSALWNSGTGGQPGASLAVQNDGNAVLYHGGAAIWDTGTCCR